MQKLISPPEANIPPNKCYILLVEDDLVVQRAHYTMLTRLGCKVDIAADGIAALKMYGNGYNIILLDCGLPDISGIDVCKCIRQVENPGEFAANTYRNDERFFKDDLEAECAEAGINEFATKPIHPKDLADILQKYGEQK